MANYPKSEAAAKALANAILEECKTPADKHAALNALYYFIADLIGVARRRRAISAGFMPRRQ